MVLRPVTRLWLVIGTATIVVADGAARQDRIVAVLDVQLSPDGTSVVFSKADRGDDRQVHLWTVPFAGGEPRRVTMAATRDARPRWSPNGRDIGYLSSPASSQMRPRVFTVSYEAGASRPITPESIGVDAFEWSPTGGRLAMMSSEPPRRGLWVIGIDGSGLRAVSTDVPTSFSWDPTGGWIASLAKDARGRLRLAIVDASARTRARFVRGDFLPPVRWSPDGRTLAVLGAGAGGVNQITLVRADGGVMRALPIRGSGRVVDVTWVANGRLSLAFAAGSDTWIELMTVPTGPRLTVLPQGIVTMEGGPSWSRDGSRYVVVGHSDEHAAEVYAGTIPAPESGRADTVGALPPPVRRITFSN